MQLKSFALLTTAVTATFAQTISFNATQIIQDLQSLTNLANITNSLAGTITAGNAIATIPTLIVDLTTYAAALVVDATQISQDASGSVFDTTDQVAICTSLNNLISAEQTLVATVASKSNIISVSLLGPVVTALLNSIQSMVNGIVNSVKPSVPNCVTTGNV